MHTKQSIAALALMAAFAAHAADQIVDFESNGTASFIGTTPVLQGGDDLIEFTGLAAGTYDFELTLSGQGIHLTDLTLNGVHGHIVSNDHFLFADVFGSGATPFELTLDGEVLNRRANYSGEISTSAVPEPASGSLLVAGVAALGLLARRRRRRATE